MSKKVAGWETKYNAKKKAVVNSEDCNVTFWSVGVEIHVIPSVRDEAKRLRELKLY